MAKKTWTIQLEDGTHLIEFDKRWASGKRTIRVDSQIVLESKPAWIDTGSDDEFRIGNHECAVHVRTNGFTGSYDLSVDGHSVQTGRPVAKLQPMPKWVWVFIVACVAVPVVTLGGAIPALLGIGGAWICVVLSRLHTRSTTTKILLAVVTTAVTWALLIAFISTVAGGRTLLTLGQPSWQEYTSQAGHYLILMPGKPQEQTQSVDSTVGTLNMHIASFEDQSGAYLVTYVDYPADVIQAGLEDNVLDGAVQGGIANANGKLARQQAISLGKFPGREVEFDAPAQGAQPAMHVKARYFLADNRLYQVLVIAQQNKGLPDAAQKFFESFQLVKD